MCVASSGELIQVASAKRAIRTVLMDGVREVFESLRFSIVSVIPFLFSQAMAFGNFPVEETRKYELEQDMDIKRRLWEKRKEFRVHKMRQGKEV